MAVKKQFPLKFQLLLTDAQHESLQKMANERNVSMGEIMRELIAKAIASKIPSVNKE